jgi:hypothetical protein
LNQQTISHVSRFAELKTMRAFVVSVNGEQLCTAGIANDGVLSSHVTWSGREGTGGFHMHVGGLELATNQHLRWPVKEIGVGDEIVTRIIETEAVDDPLSRLTRAEIEADHRKAEPDQTTPPNIAAALMLLDRQTRSWKREGSKSFTVLPRIGEWLAIEIDGIEMIAKIVMVAHSSESSESVAVTLHAVVEGDTSDCLKDLMGP